jgi:hypothetical protein
MVAHYNAPDNAADLTASFHTAAEAQAYADEYGGDVLASGVVFTVRNADHDRAREDAAALAREEARKAYAQAGGDTPTPAPAQSQEDFDAAMNAAVERAMLARAGTTTPEPDNA